MNDRNVSRNFLDFNDEDYTNSLCLLLPKGQATLIDIEDYGRVVDVPWVVLGDSIFYQEPRKRKSATMRQLSRLIIAWDRGSCENWNFQRRLDKSDVDHANRNRWDNRRCNLRLATKSQNCMNKAKTGSKKSSRFKGVSWDASRDRWKASAMFESKRYNLGYFKHEVEAAMAYNQFILDKCPEHGWLNRITVGPDDEPTKVPRRRKYKGAPIRRYEKPLVPCQKQKPEPADWSTLQPKPPEGVSLIDFLMRRPTPEEMAAIHARAAARRVTEEARRAERKRRLESRKGVAPHWQA